MMRPNSNPSKKPSPKYLQVAQWLEEKIQKGEYKVNEQLLGEAAFAKELKVSTITVRQAFELLRKRGFVSRVPYQGTFVAERWGGNATASTPAEGGNRVKNILVLAAYCDSEPVGTSFSPWNGRQDQIRAAFEKEISDHGYHCVGKRLVRSKNEAAFSEGESSHYAAAILLADTLTSEEQSRYVVELSKAKLPYVVTDYFGHLPSNRVQENLILGVEEALDHLDHLGHTHIGLLTFDTSSKWREEWPWLRIRREAFIQGILQRDWTHTAEDILSLPLPNLPEGGDIALLQQSLGADMAQHYMQQILTSSCTAWVAVNDRVALGFLSELKRVDPGLAERLSIIGFDNEPGAQDANLTTVASPCHEMGMGAARMLLELVNAQRPRHVRTMDFSPSLLRRSSTRSIGNMETEDMMAGAAGTVLKIT